MVDAPYIDLHKTMNAEDWAKEFCKRYVSGLSQVEGQEGVTQGDDWEHIMMGWFANAIMCGHDHACIANGLSTGSSADRELAPLYDNTPGQDTQTAIAKMEKRNGSSKG